MLKNWFRAFYIMFCIAGAAVYIVALVLIPRSEVTAALICLLLAPLVFFIGTIIYNLFKYSAKCEVKASYTLLASGSLATILLCVGALSLFGDGGIARIIADFEDGSDRAVWYSQFFVTFAFFGKLIVFELLPMAKGISKTLAVTEELSCPDCEPKSADQDVDCVETSVKARHKKKTEEPTAPAQQEVKKPSTAKK